MNTQDAALQEGASDEQGSFGIEKQVTTATNPVIAVEQSIPEETLQAAFRRVDFRLLAWYCFVHLVMKMNAHNVTNAAIMNIEAGTDIKHQLGSLSSGQWALVLSISHYPYILLQPASTILLKKYTPRKWMGLIMLSWGVISMCQAATQSFGGILACQLLLGFSEAGFVPGVLYHLSFWFPTQRLPMRIAIFYAIGVLSGTTSGLFAFAISFLDGEARLAGWRYLFIIEGIPGIICAVVTLIFLPDYPQTATFLDEQQKGGILATLPETAPSSNDKTWDWGQVKHLLTDWTTLSFYFIWLAHAVGAKGIHTVLPTIIYELGLTNTTIAQLMTMPCYIFGSAVLLLIAWQIRRQKLRSWIAALVLELFALICYIILMFVQAPIVQYVFVMLAMTSSIGLFPILWPERIRAAHGTTTAGLAIGLTNSAAQMQGIIGPQIYQPKFGPRYRVSFTVSMALLVFDIVGVAVTWLAIRRRDGKREDHR